MTDYGDLDRERWHHGIEPEPSDENTTCTCGSGQPQSGKHRLSCAIDSEPQAEPSDVQRYRAAIEDALPMLGLFRPWDVSPEQIENVRVILARAVTEQGENR